jgi:hypothetical protein
MTTLVDRSRVIRVLDLYLSNNLKEAHELISECTVDELTYLCEKIDRAIAYARD